MSRSFYYPATLAMLGLVAAASLNGAEIAAATIGGTQIAPGEFHYTLTLNDIGTTTLGTFWFSWVPGDNFMPVSPIGVASPSGWNDTVTNGGPSHGFAIQWTAIASANDLAAGSSLSGFSFDSSLTLAQLQSPSAGRPLDPVLTTFVYSGAPFSDAGFQLTAQPVTSTVPEPSTLILGASALAALSFRLRRIHILLLHNR